MTGQTALPLRGARPFGARWRDLKLALLAAPAVVLLVAILVLPLLDLVSLSVAGLTFEPYRSAIGDPLYLAVL